MNDRKNTFSNPDEHLDALLKKRTVVPSADFTATTLGRIRDSADVSDDFMDRMLATSPVTPSTDFTARTMRRLAREKNLWTFLRPAFAAAASVAISLSGVWIYDAASTAQSAGVADIAAAPLAAPSTQADTGDMDEIRELAAALKDAAPLLDPKAADTFAMVASE